MSILIQEYNQSIYSMTLNHLCIQHVIEYTMDITLTPIMEYAVIGDVITTEIGLLCLLYCSNMQYACA